MIVDNPDALLVANKDKVQILRRLWRRLVSPSLSPLGDLRYLMITLSG